jgi:hypothetical protein
MARPAFSVTGTPKARLLSAVGDSMAIESDRYDNHEDPLEQSELARRLRRMEWPPAPPDVKERVLSRIVPQSGQEPGPDVHGDSRSKRSRG